MLLSALSTELNVDWCFQDHSCRSEGVYLAQELDGNAATAWIGHPYFDVIDNTTNFEQKIRRMIEVSYCLVASSLKIIVYKVTKITNACCVIVSNFALKILTLAFFLAQMCYQT